MSKGNIHKFYLNEKYIVLDINSGSVHVVDKIVYDILDYYLDHEIDEIIDILANEYPRDMILNAYKEIELLENEDLIFSNDLNTNFEYNKENVIKAMCLHVAHDCNLKCRYCFASQGNFKGQRQLMDLETGMRALDFLVENSGNRKNLEVDFFGGEPLMNFDVVKDLVAYGRKLEKKSNKHFRFTITTNALLLNDENMNFINENMDNVVLSLDGRKSVNDYMRMTLNDGGSYDVIVPKIKEMIERRKDKDYYVRGTFTSKNLDFSKDCLEYYKNGFKNISIEPVVTDPKEDYAIREEHIETILKEYEEFSREYMELRKNDPEFLFFHFMIDLNQGPCAVKKSVGCGAGSEYIAVTPEGDIFPCHQFVGEEEFKLGTLQTGITNTKLRDKFKQANVNTKEKCKTCWAKFYCSGGCHANAYYSNNNILEPHELSCRMEKKRLECAISILANE
ncbi:thioether cross-link-forming SCIFF peptide maturase [Soehngenia saccharolytica]|nr:thioether cross-link-forming SCIFF peptide maturase [Soehngenia saccharolytica]